MKHLIIGGAAGLLLSTTALAAVGATNKDMAATATQSPAPVSKSAPSLDTTPIANAILIDHPAKSANLDAAPASDAKTFTAGDSKAPAAELAAAETPSTAAMTDAAKDMQGVGGPDEGEPTAAAAAVPQGNYRACSPGPGDDNCIQLYEPGVGAAYAAWQADGAPGAAQTGMGGPEEDEPAAAAVEPATGGAKDMTATEPATETEDSAAEPAAAGSDDLAAYDEPLPEDLVLPASEETAGNQPSRASDSTTAL